VNRKSKDGHGKPCPYEEKAKIPLSLIIQKYGGKALASAEDVQQVAQLIYERHRAGTDLVIVVSAMGDTTDRYLGMARSVNPSPAGRELDVLLSVGERISIAMLALALNSLENDLAVSLTGAQAGIITDTVHTAAQIVEIRPLRVREILDQHRIPIIAGYQGITTDKNISTLGRGGTDATAVGLAVALGAERVEFMKDVDGVQSADPKQIHTARVIEQMSYEDVLQMMGCGAKILQAPAVEMAAEYHVKLAVGNSKTGVTGTILTDRPLGRRTLTAVVLTNKVRGILYDSTSHLLQAVKSLREAGCSPLLAGSSGGRSLLLIKDDDPIARGLFEAPLIPNETLSLVTLLGPGVGGVTELADHVHRKLAPYVDQLAALSITESRLSALLPAAAAAHFAESAHSLCLHDDSARSTASIHH
jgi:aspartate kinase